MPQLTVCPSCAEHLEPEDKFCGNCGAPLADADPPLLGAEHLTGADADAGHLTGAEADAEHLTGAEADAGHLTGADADAEHLTGADPDAGHLAGADPDAGHLAGADADAEHLTGADAAGAGRDGESGFGVIGDAPTGSYSLAPPAPGHPPQAAPTPQAAPIPVTVPVSSSTAERSVVPPAPPRAGAVDPRQGMLAQPEPEPAGDCVSCEAGTVGDDGFCTRCGHRAPRERDHVERQLPTVAAVSDKGLRHHRNEDAFALAEAERPDGGRAIIAVVCDGVSSATRPDEASAAASQAGGAQLANDLADGAEPRQAMPEALLTAAAAVSALAPPEAAGDPHFNAPACTCVSAVLIGDLLTVGWIGDSRAYWIPAGGTQEPARLTEDDSWAARMVEAGLMSEADAYADPRAHAITGWLGADAEELDPHTASFHLDTPGVVLVCTDGLWNYAESAAELAAVLPSGARTDPLGCARSLVQVALDGGGHDNVTVAVLPFPAADGGAEGAGERRA
jgi:serine/threonine protein phosphatase PrpC